MTKTMMTKTNKYRVARKVFEAGMKAIKASIVVQEHKDILDATIKAIQYIIEEKNP